MRVLIVDDDKFYSAIAKRKLAGVATSIVEAGDGESACTLLAHEQFDLALVDLGLPDVDGFALISYIRNNPRTRYLPIIVVTGREDREAIDDAYDAGASFFLSKPINWPLFKYHISGVMRLADSENRARRKQVVSQAESRVKDSVVARLAHVFEPSLNEIESCAWELHLLANGSDEPASLRTIAERISCGHRQLSEEIRNMETFAKALSGQLIMEEAPVRLDELLECLHAQMRLHAERKNVDLSFEDLSDSVVVNCDGELLIHALCNLVENAVDYSDPGSSVTVSPELTSGGELLINISDSGCGIEANRLIRILDPSRCLEEDGGATGELYGLGLSVAKLVAEAQGGSLTLRSRVGHGTTATIVVAAENVSQIGKLVA